MSQTEQFKIDRFMEGTAFYRIVPDPASAKAVPTVLRLLNVTQIPSLCLIDSTGRPRREIESAIEWNEDENPQTVIDRWREGGSGLTISQQLLVGASSTCCLM